MNFHGKNVALSVFWAISASLIASLVAGYPFFELGEEQHLTLAYLKKNIFQETLSDSPPSTTLPLLTTTVPPTTLSSDHNVPTPSFLETQAVDKRFVIYPTALLKAMNYAFDFVIHDGGAWHEEGLAEEAFRRYEIFIGRYGKKLEGERRQRVKQFFKNYAALLELKFSQTHPGEEIRQLQQRIEELEAGYDEKPMLMQDLEMDEESRSYLDPLFLFLSSENGLWEMIILTISVFMSFLVFCVNRKQMSTFADKGVYFLMAWILPLALISIFI